GWRINNWCIPPHLRSFPMKYASIKFAASAVVIAALAACGGGGDDAPTPSDANAIVTLSGATDASVNGIYGTGNISLGDVTKTEREGTDDCSFTFADITRAGDGAKIGGRVEYQDNANVVQNFRITFGGANYSTANKDNTEVDRANNRVRVTGKQLTEEGGARVVTVSGVIPMRASRPDGC
ncbi:MAG: hypothetical protein ABW051_02140, partial [Burkholderiaceae bacterium]